MNVLSANCVLGSVMLLPYVYSCAWETPFNVPFANSTISPVAVGLISNPEAVETAKVLRSTVIVLPIWRFAWSAADIMLYPI